MARLSVSDRKNLSRGSFAIPSKAPGAGSYPINDAAHARNALSRVSRFGSPAERSAVRSAVSSRYPDIGRGKARSSPRSMGR